MALDWIKIQMSTPEKPEVIRMARKLGISRDDALGKLFRLWAWFDSNSVDGVVDGVVSTDVDALVGLDGFASVMGDVGWLKWNDEAETITMPNFDKHNGESAKKRGLKAQRQAKWRQNKDGHVDKSVDASMSTTSTTREEKRREDNNKGRFTPPTVAEVSAYCRERNNSIDAQQFVDHYESNGWFRGKTKIKDWKACVRTWEQNRSSGQLEQEVRAGL